jgi:hypothetical protein
VFARQHEGFVLRHPHPAKQIVILLRDTGSDQIAEALQRRLGRILDDEIVSDGGKKIADDARGEVGGTTFAPDLGKSRADRSKEDQVHRGEGKGIGRTFQFVLLVGSIN